MIVEVRAELAGNVWKIVVGLGERVKEDDTVLILESMKMEIPVLAPESGTVSEILVSEGESVTEGAVLVRIGI